MSTPIPAGGGSRLCAYETSFNNQQHVFFVGTDKCVHEFCYADHWYHNDVTGLATVPTAAPVAVPTAALVGYVTAWNQQQHVIYLSAHGGAGYRINELCYADRWYHHDLTGEATDPTPAPLAASGSALAGYVTNCNKQQHVIYLGADEHVHELCYADRWYHHDLLEGGGLLVADDGDVVAKAGSALAGNEITFGTDLDWQQAVYFVRTKGYVHGQLYDERGWTPWSVFEDAFNGPNPAAAAGTALAAFQTEDSEQGHVVLVGADNHVHELVANQDPWYYTWHTDDVTTRAGIALNAVPGSLVGVPLFGHNQCLMYVCADDGRVHGLNYLAKPNKWYPKDWTSDCNAAMPISGSPLAVYKTTYEGGEYVYAVFLGPKNHVCQLVPSGPDSHDLSVEYY